MDHSDFKIAWICALADELAAAIGMLDEVYPDLPRKRHDSNTYKYGRIGRHNVVLACLPSGVTGVVSAAQVAAAVRASFSEFRIGLMVGIGGGIPDVESSGQRDIRLGDVIVSRPTATSGGVVQYDMGKTVQGNRFLRTGSLNRPPNELLTAVSLLEAKHIMEGSEVPQYVSAMIKTYPRMQQRFSYPGAQQDRLFKAMYEHQSTSTMCLDCDVAQEVSRPTRLDERPMIHYGIIASGNRLMRDGETRDQIAATEGALCFEMEAAGLMNTFPCLVIRGVCDYADSHKNKLWQPYAAAVAAAFAKELLCTIPPEEVGSNHNPSQAPKLQQRFSNVPLQRVVHFVQRPSLRDQIKEQLHDRLDDPIHNSQVVVVYGFGGMGKTQLVLDYIHTFHNDYSGVFWVNASRSKTVEQSIESIYRILFLRPETGEIEVPEVSHMLAQIKNKFYNGHERWLWVIDNADSIEDEEHADFVDLRELIPHASCVHTIITSRNSNAKSITTSTAVFVQDMEPQQALALFWSTSRLDPSTISEQKIRLAEDIVKELGYLALAVSFAGSNIMESRIMTDDLSLYLESYRKNKRILLSRKPVRTSEPYNSSILAAWETSFESISQRSTLAAGLIGFIAMLDTSDINFGLFTAALESKMVSRDNLPNPDWLWQSALRSGAEIDVPELESAFLLLESYCFLRYVKSNAYYTMHNLVKEWAIGRLAFPLQAELSRAVSDFIIVVTRHHSQALLDRCRIGRHIVANFNIGSRIIAARPDSEVIEMLDQFDIYADFLQEQRQWTNLQLIYCFRHSHLSKIRGSEHPDTIGALDDMAMVLRCQHKFDESLKMTELALEKTRQIYGDDHPLTWDQMECLGFALEHRDPTNLTQVYTALLERQQKTFGPDHPATLDTMLELALSLAETGQSDGFQMFETVLEKLRQSFGDCHPKTLSSMARVGDCLDRHKMPAGLQMMEDVLKKRRDIYGDDHPETISATSMIAMSSGYKNKPEALEMLQSVIEKRQLVFGEEHPDTIEALYYLGRAYQMRDDPRAEMMLREVLELQRRVLGEDHPDIIDSMRHLAVCLAGDGKPEAEAMFTDVLEKSQHNDGFRNMDLFIRTMDQAKEMYMLKERTKTLSEKNEHLARLVRVVEQHRSLHGRREPLETQSDFEHFESPEDWNASDPEGGVSLECANRL